MPVLKTSTWSLILIFTVLFWACGLLVSSAKTETLRECLAQVNIGNFNERRAKRDLCFALHSRGETQGSATRPDSRVKHVRKALPRDEEGRESRSREVEKAAPPAVDNPSTKAQEQPKPAQITTSPEEKELREIREDLSAKRKNLDELGRQKFATLKTLELAIKRLAKAVDSRDSQFILTELGSIRGDVEQARIDDADRRAARSKTIGPLEDLRRRAEAARDKSNNSDAASNEFKAKFDVLALDISKTIAGEKQNDEDEQRQTSVRLSSIEQQIIKARENLESLTRDRPSVQDQPRVSLVSTGTGFFVSTAGHILTNSHVADNCARLAVRYNEQIYTTDRVLAADRVNDLALLKVDSRSHAFAAVRSDARLAEPIAVFGFPLFSRLASTGNFTLGNITATAGLGDDTTIFQISAPVQPGNSGGPVLDQSGRVVGVVVSKLRPRVAVTKAGPELQIPENVNFAIKGNIAANFLQANGVSVVPDTNTSPLSPPDLADKAKTFSVLIGCFR